MIFDQSIAPVLIVSLTAIAVVGLVSTAWVIVAIVKVLRG